MSLQQAFQSPSHLAFGQHKAAYNLECQHCQGLHVCYGGCIKDRICDPRDKGHNHFCESYQFFFKRAHDDFKKLGMSSHPYYQ